MQMTIHMIFHQIMPYCRCNCYMSVEYHKNRFFKSFGILSFAAWKGHTVIVELLILKQS